MLYLFEVLQCPQWTGTCRSETVSSQFKGTGKSSRRNKMWDIWAKCFLSCLSLSWFFYQLCHLKDLFFISEFVSSFSVYCQPLIFVLFHSYCCVRIKNNFHLSLIQVRKGAMEMHIECKITVNVPQVRLQKLMQVFTDFKLKTCWE